MLFWLLILLIGAVLAVLAYAAMRPGDFRIARTQRIDAPPDKIFPLINDLHAFNSWNPYAKMDPAIKGSYAGPASGKGAAYQWESKKVGNGRMEILDTAPPSRIAMELHMLTPFERRNAVEFTIVPQGAASEVTWAMSGKHAFVPKLMGLFFSMDGMIGKAFAEGLAGLKAQAEK